MNTTINAPSALNELKSILSKIDTVCWDLWGTVARSDNREPIRDLQRILEYLLQHLRDNDITSVDPEFLDVCLTTNQLDPKLFLTSVANHFKLPVRDDMLSRFQKVLHEEATCSGIFLDAKKSMKALRNRGYKMVLVSNLWPFPVECLFAEDNLGKYFPEELRVYSFREGISKPNPELYRRVETRTGSKPENCLMIGDSLENDIIPAMAVGMKTCLIDRQGKYPASEVPEGVWVIRSMEALIECLPEVPKV